MPKRDRSKPPKTLKKRKQVTEAEPQQETPSLEYEDPYEDEYSSEADAIYHSGSSVGEAEEWEEFQNLKLEPTPDGNVQLVHDPNYHHLEEPQESDPKDVWKGDPRQIKKGEFLDFENEAYEYFYRTSVEWPCLSLDYLLGDTSGPPYTVNIVSGSQAGDNKNKVYVMKWSELYKTQEDDKSESSSDESQEGGDEPKLDYAEFPHQGVVNRIRAFQEQNIVATWSDRGTVCIYSLSSVLESLSSSQGIIRCKQPQSNFFEFGQEGYGLEWGYQGRLYAGAESIYQLDPNGSGWAHTKTFAGHKGPVEDIQKSPAEEFVFASCSVDGTIKIWDTRVESQDSQITINAHNTDVNVISWNKNETSQIASGSDDSTFKIWDLRFTQQQAACIKWHSDSITSICWNPFEASEIAVASADDTLTVWDLSVEAEGEVEPGYPPQLLFVHHGQEDIKEISYHSQMQFILSTASNSFNLFKPSINLQ